MTAREEFPDLPQWLTAGIHAATPAGMRPFGASQEDLTVDFRMARRPELMTQLLCLCCESSDGLPSDDALFLKMPIGLRIALIVRLAQLTNPGPFSWHLHCTCNEENEFELTAAQILSLSDGILDSESTSVVIGEDTSTVRRPTAHDQMRWLSQSDESQSKAMLRSILVSPSLEELLGKGHTLDSIAVALEGAMDSFDPLPCFQLSVGCPQCGITQEVSPDLTGAALDRLQRAQRAALEDVHRLASRYHWTEDQILGLPQWRRQSYLELIEGGTG